MIGPGARLGRYELREPLGSGGMSAVYRGYDPTLQREIAVKVLAADLARDAVYQARFLEEARALGRVDHPNLVRIYAVGQDGAICWYAMELIRGLSLRDAVRTRRLAVAEALAVLAQFLPALDAIHRAGIVHRDIKPGNVMLSDSGRVVLMDFGLARRADRPTMTAPGSVLGTPEYMAPEQALGKTADARADLYATGVLLFEMLAGAPPFGGRDTLAILRKHVEAAPPPLRKLAADTPEAIEAVVRKLLAKKPQDRYPDVAALLDALRPQMPPARGAEDAVRALVLQTQEKLSRQTRSLPGATETEDTLSRSHAALRPRWNRAAWGAIASAVLAVAVALLALLKPPAADTPWRRVTLRDGDSFVGRLDAVRQKPSGDQDWIYLTRDGGRRSVAASHLRRDAQDRGGLGLTALALSVAGVSLVVAGVVLYRARKESS